MQTIIVNANALPEAVAPWNAVKYSYDSGRCPDCQTVIPDDVVEGQACENCGHVFYALKPRKFEVVIVSKAQDTYIVEAIDEEEAYHLAEERFHKGENGDLPASDYQSIENLEARPLA